MLHGSSRRVKILGACSTGSNKVGLFLSKKNPARLPHPGFLRERMSSSSTIKTRLFPNWRVFWKGSVLAFWCIIGDLH